MIRRRLKRSSGQGLIEFAVIFPLFMILVGAVIDGGLLMGRYNSINNAAKEGARLGAISTDPNRDITSIVQRVKDGAMGQLGGLPDTPVCGNAYDASNTAICVEWISGPVIGGSSQSPGELGSSIRVRVKYRYTPITPIFSQVGTFDVSACATERIERPVDTSGVPVDAAAHGCSGDAGAATATPAPTATPTRCRDECGD